MDKELEIYKQYIQKMKMVSGMSALLSWDQETFMPENAIQDRALQSSFIDTYGYELSTNKDYVKSVNTLFDNKDKLNSIWKRSVEVSKKNLNKSLKLNSKFVEETSKLLSLSHNAWVEAKQKEDFSIFSTYLEKIFQNRKSYAEMIDNSKPVYDVLLDDFDEGLTGEQIDRIFQPLGEEIKNLLANIKIRESSKAFNRSYDKHKLLELMNELVEKMGFDLRRGMIGEVHHPFETRISDNDIRINTKFPEKDFLYPITSTIHELGHGLYEQNIDKQLLETSLGSGQSLIIHESQSRFLENIIGRSREFLEYLKSQIEESFPEFKETEFDDFYNDINLVRPSLIRTEADEVTYPLHIVIRYEIENMVLNKEVSISELPELWNQKMKYYLGIEPKKISEGVLQDVHWSIGAVGYFPTYALGSLFSASLKKSFLADNPKAMEQISKGDFSTYNKWFEGKVWKNGSLYSSVDLVRKITGKDLSYEDHVEYLKAKYIL